MKVRISNSVPLPSGASWTAWLVLAWSAGVYQACAQDLTNTVPKPAGPAPLVETDRAPSTEQLRSNFPASTQRASIALTLATGVGVPELQARINQLQDKAIKRAELSEDEKRFLTDLYTCLAEGGALVAPETSKLMQRYLSRTGEPLSVSSNLFTRSMPVRLAMEELRRQVLADIARDGKFRAEYGSKTFYMGDPNYFDSFAGLYDGVLKGRPSVSPANAVVLHWRAEVPWEWPTYESVFRKYGSFNARSFPLPNASSVIAGPRYSLHIDDGLGGYLPVIGLAKPFLSYSEWDETLPSSGAALSSSAVNKGSAQLTFNQLPIGAKFYFPTDTGRNYPWTKLTYFMATNMVSGKQTTVGTDAQVQQ